MILATQYTAQLSDSSFGNQNNLLAAILGNVGTIISFRLGQEDAVKIAPIYQPQFSTLDIIGLPNWNGYVRMQLNGQATPPCSFKKVKNQTPFDDNLASRIRTASRLKYGVDCKTVDMQIQRRRNIWQES